MIRVRDANATEKYDMHSSGPRKYYFLIFHHDSWHEFNLLPPLKMCTRVGELKDMLRTTLGLFKTEQEWEEARHRVYLLLARDVVPGGLLGDPRPFVNHSFQRLGKLRSIVEEITRVVDDLNS